MRHRLLLIVATSLALGFPTSGATIHVPADAPSIAAAVELAEPGDEIVVAPGTYETRVHFERSITVRGSDPSDPSIVERTVLRPLGDEQQIITTGNPDAWGERPRVTIAGLTFTGAPFGAIKTETDTTLRIEDCLFSGNLGRALWIGADNSDDSAASILRCDFVGNLGSPSDILLAHGNLKAERCRFVATPASGEGTGVHTRPNAAENVSFTDCAFSVQGDADPWTMLNMQGGYLTARRCTFTGDPAASEHRGLRTNGILTIIEDCEFAHMSDRGHVASGQQLIVRRCVYRDSDGPRGTGLSLNSGLTALIEGCRFDRLISTASGGAMEIANAATLVTGCVFTDNSASTGAAISISGSGTVIENCLIARNTSTTGRGAIRIFGSDCLVSHCTIVGNTSPGIAGIGTSQMPGAPASIRIANCILDNNDFVPLGTFASASLDPIIENTIIRGGPIDYADALTIDPLFADPAKGDYSLTLGSPAIDAGNNADLSGAEFDALGNPRFVNDPGVPDALGQAGPVADLGAIEFQGATAGCLGDCDGSGAVDFGDLVSMLFGFGPSSGESDGCDADRSGDVNFNDLVFTLFRLGACG